MPIDPSIIQGIKPIQLANPLDQYGQIMQIRQAQNTNRLADLVYGEKQREVSDTNALNQAYAGALGQDGQIDRNKLYTSLATANLGSKLPAVQKSFADADKAQVDAHKAKLETGIKQLEMVGQIAGSVTDPTSFAQANAYLKAQGIPALGDAYDPAALKQIANMALSRKDQLEQTWKAMEYTTPKADAVLAANTSRANNAATNATTMRGQNMTDTRQREQIAAGRVPSGYRMRADGAGLEPIPGGPAEKDKALTETQGKATGFAARMQSADQTIGNLIAGGVKTPSIIKQTAEGVPLVGGALGNAANFVASSDQQRMEQAQRDFVNAVLRQESGAAISQPEFDNARKQYFPQPGDSGATIQQKARNRAIAIEAMKAQAGPGTKSVNSIANTQPAAGGIKFLGFE